MPSRHSPAHAEPSARSGAGSSRQSLIAAVLCIAGTVVALQQTLVIPLIPEWPTLLHTSADNTSWLVTATLLAGAVATPILARLADMVGKKKIMLVSLAFVIVGSVIGGIGSGLGALVVARTFQGVGASMIPIGISILRDELPREKVGGAVATMSATLGIGSAIGLPLAGFLVEHFSWHMVFWVSVVSASLMFAAVALVVPESKVTSRGRFDLVGAVLLSAALLCLLVPITKGGQWGWGSERVLLLFAASIALFAVWAPYELRHNSPMVDLRTSARRPVLLTNAASLLVGFAMYANMMTTTQQLQMPEITGYGFGMSVIAAGVAMLPGGLAMVVLSPASAAVTKRFGARTTLLAGALGLAASYTLRVFLTGAVWQVVLGATLCSAATAFAYAAMPTLIMRSVPLTETASANGLNTLLRSIGTSTSSAAVAAILTNMAMHVDGHDLPKLAAFKAVFVMAAIAALASAIVAAFVPTAQPASASAPSATPATHPAPASADKDAVRGGDSREIVATGTLVGLDGHPVRRGVVTALASDGAHLDWGRVDDDGCYRLALPGAGRYVLVASAEGWATRSRIVEVTGPGLPQLSLVDPLQLTGVVRRSDGSPAAQVPVTLIKHSGEYHADTLTDGEGRYVMPLPPGGRYVVAALDAEHDATAAASVTVLTEPVSADITL
ncbi:MULTISPECIES: MFS transporter [Dermacoccus]|uniref:MFS transporter n=1 Tax=Dermacoccus TaxID=57495 RepID=UPI0013F40622|nr:MFS transporter [Dermacoccus nishinomiyaensis]